MWPNGCLMAAFCVGSSTQETIPWFWSVKLKFLYQGNKKSDVGNARPSSGVLSHAHITCKCNIKWPVHRHVWSRAQISVKSYHHHHHLFCMHNTYSFPQRKMLNYSQGNIYKQLLPDCARKQQCRQEADVRNNEMASGRTPRPFLPNEDKSWQNSENDNFF